MVRVSRQHVHRRACPSRERDPRIRTGDTLRAEVRGPGEVLLVRDTDPVAQYAGALTGVYAPGELDELRREWD